MLIVDKLIVQIYLTYGMGKGDTLSEQFIINDTREGRESVFDYFVYDELHTTEEDILSGEVNNFSFETYGGTWECPTGGYVVISTKAQLINKFIFEAEKRINAVEKMFAK